MRSRGAAEGSSQLIMSIAMVFPGQGSQSLGMLSSLAGEEEVRATFAEATRVLGFDLWALTQSGPAERLDATEHTQPAMLAAGVAIWRVWQHRGGVLPSAVAGHSLGEFTALVCAGSLELAAAIDLVRFRGRAMQEAVPAGAGAMAAILGLDDGKVAEACAAAAEGGVVEPVNFNAPGQLVVAGERAAVERAAEAARRLGAKRAVMLSVSVPAHSSLMRPAADRLRERLATLELAAPRIAYVSAVDAGRHTEPADIRKVLERQIVCPVRWQDTVRALVSSGHRTLLECGPGKVLTALNRRIARDVECFPLEDEPAIGAALEACHRAGEPASPDEAANRGEG